MGVDRELLTKCELDDGLVLAAPEEGENAPEDRDRESRCRPHCGAGFCSSRGCERSLNRRRLRVYPLRTTDNAAGRNVSRIS
jgi:hypothetical protein